MPPKGNDDDNAVSNHINFNNNSVLFEKDKQY